LEGTVDVLAARRPADSGAGLLDLGGAARLLLLSLRGSL
jgi:hypothetical protein